MFVESGFSDMQAALCTWASM